MAAAHTAVDEEHEEQCWIDQFSLFDRVKEQFTESTRISRRLFPPMVPLIMLGYAIYLLYVWDHEFLTDSKIETSQSGCYPLGTLNIGADADFALKLTAVGASTQAANPAVPTRPLQGARARWKRHAFFMNSLFFGTIKKEYKRKGRVVEREYY